jgi:hypothetical protein
VGLYFQLGQSRHVGFDAPGQVGMPFERDVVGQEPKLPQVLVHHRFFEVLAHVRQVDARLFQVKFLIRNEMQSCYKF